MLFDLQDDPGETRNIFQNAPADLRAQLAASLETWDATHSLNLPGVPEKLRQLLEANLADCLRPRAH